MHLVRKNKRGSYTLRPRARLRDRIVDRKASNAEDTGQLLRVLNTDSPVHHPFSPIDLLRSNLPLGEYRCEEVKGTQLLTSS